jgi:hypothetical protein
MNEFLLFAFIVIYLAIRHGAPSDGTGNHETAAGEDSSNFDGKQ